MSETGIEIEPHEAVRHKIAELESFLQSNGIAIERWGTGATKSIDALLEEIEKGESYLDVVELNGKEEVVRKASLVNANIFYTTPNGSLLRLCENYQRFADGRVRERQHVTESIAEKIMGDENPNDALLRALAEELAITADSSQAEYVKTYLKQGESQSYPGLVNILQIHQSDVFLTANQFDPEGYIEEQPDKTTYFVWRSVDTDSQPSASTA